MPGIQTARTDKLKAETDSNMQESVRRPWMWHASTGWCLLSILLYWLSFPPVDWWLLAWIAPYGWIRVILQPELTGRRPRATLYLTSWLHWLAMTYWVTLPHPLAAVGWLFLAAYLAIYLYSFIIASRYVVHRGRIPALITIPSMWVAMEVLRTYLFSGFGLVALSHSQVDFLSLLQIANVTGAYGISFLIILFATAVTVWFRAPQRSMRGLLVQLAAPGTLFLVAIAYGAMILQGEQIHDSDASGTKVAIIQGRLDTEFPKSQEDAKRIRELQEEAFADYSRMTSEATAKQQVDLVLWPESMFGRYYGVLEYDAEMADRAMGADGMTMETLVGVSEVATKQHIQLFGTNCLLGTNTTHYHTESIEQFNTAAFYNGDGELVGSYHKMHLVMFGEYIPLGDWLPWLYRFAPIPGAVSRGSQPEVFEVEGLHVAPLICFENTVPQLVTRHLYQLERTGTPATTLVTLTNDGWFWGSALLDLHLACGIFRAIENRRPMLIAANTGISAHVDGCGRVLQAAPKRVSRVLLADVVGSNAWSCYTHFGDWFGFSCCGLALLGLILGYRGSQVVTPDEQLE